MPEIIRELTAFSPAKVNLYLTVIGSRSDGFHDIDSVFMAVDFGDILHFSVKNDKADENSSNLINISMSGLDLKDNELLSRPENNIIFRAISLFREKTGFSNNIVVNVEKRIPLGGGLGGGSSNAACALLSLNKMTGFPCRRDELLEMAASLGSDVPFFIFQTAAARVTGRGECITPIDASLLHFVLVNPGFPSDTARAFRLLDEYRSSDSFTMKPLRAEEGLRITGLFCPGDSWLKFNNDFLPVFPQAEKAVYDKINSALREAGSVYANLSGAGASCFGVFSNEETARKAAESLSGEHRSEKRESPVRWYAECCKTIYNQGE